MNQDQNEFWLELQRMAREMATDEQQLASYFHQHIYSQPDFTAALSSIIAVKLHTEAVSEMMLRELFVDCLQRHPDVLESAYQDLLAYYDRDPACDSYHHPLLYFKGFHATQAYRLANLLWREGRRYLARYIHAQATMQFDVDIHPAAHIGGGFMVDHGTGLVIGETAIVGNNVSMLHGVTLGGSGCERGRRHPSVGDGVMISCGAKLLGAITIGEGAKIGGGSLVLESVDAHVTVVGVPATAVGRPDDRYPALSMEQSLNR